MVRVPIRTYLAIFQKKYEFRRGKQGSKRDGGSSEENLTGVVMIQSAITKCRAGAGKETNRLIL